MIGNDVEEDAKGISSSVFFRPSNSSTSAAIPHKPAAYRRKIDDRTGRALELLGHAIEYLADELIEEGGPLTARDGRLQAIQILMALNREIYLACPVVPTLRERVLAFLRAHSGSASHKDSLV